MTLIVGQMQERNPTGCLLSQPDVTKRHRLLQSEIVNIEQQPLTRHVLCLHHYSSRGTNSVVYYMLLFSLQAGVLTLLVSSPWFELVRHLESQKLQLPHEKPQKHGNTKLSSAKRLFCCIFQGITDIFVLSIHGLNSILSMESHVCFHSMEWHPWNGTIP